MAAVVLFLSFIEEGLTTAAPLLGIIDFGVHSTLTIVDDGLIVVSRVNPLIPSIVSFPVIAPEAVYRGKTSFIEEGLTTAARLLGIIDFGVHSTLTIVDDGLIVVSRVNPLIPSIVSFPVIAPQAV